MSQTDPWRGRGTAHVSRAAGSATVYGSSRRPDALHHASGGTDGQSAHTSHDGVSAVRAGDNRWLLRNDGFVVCTQPARRTEYVVAPTLPDPFARATSAAVSGPLGVHARASWSWWNPLMTAFTAELLADCLRSGDGQCIADLGKRADSVVVGVRRPVGWPLLEEGVAPFRCLVGAVGEPGRLTGEELLTDQPVVDEVEGVLQHPLGGR